MLSMVFHKSVKMGLVSRTTMTEKHHFVRAGLDCSVPEVASSLSCVHLLLCSACRCNSAGVLEHTDGFV